MQTTERTINSDTRLTVRRLLPVNGEVLVQRGARVTPLDIVARAELAHRYQVINVARLLAQPNVEMSEVMRKAEGDPVEANEAIAVASGGLPFFQRAARATAKGHIAKIGPGWVLLETERHVIEVPAFVNGIVASIIPNRGVVIEGSGAVIEAACGLGGEAYGRLRRLVNSPYEVIEGDSLDETVEQAILVGGRTVDEELLWHAEEMKVRGIIVGSIDASLLKLEPLPKVRVVATEGFGSIPMSPYTFGLLNAIIGREISIRGQTRSLAAPILREIEQDTAVILASTGVSSMATLNQLPARPASTELKVGDRVCVTRGRYFGANGQVNAIPQEPLTNGVGLKTSGAHVTIEGTSHYIPWANLEKVV